MRTQPRKLLRFAAAAVFLLLAASLPAADDGGIISIDQIQPGMKGIAYTIFSGDTVEPMDLEVIGILHNALGPKQDVILVQMHGEKVEHSGVVAGMSGSPVYFNGKLAGALSLKLGIFTKEAIGGVTPIQNIFDIQNSLPASPATLPAIPTRSSATATDGAPAAGMKIEIPADILRRAPLGAGNYLTPIETPLIATGISPEALAQFGSQFTALGMATAMGGTTASFARRREHQARRHGRDATRGWRSFAHGGLHGYGDRRRPALCLRPSTLRIRLAFASAAARPCGDDSEFRDGLDQNHEHQRRDRNAHGRSHHGGHGPARRSASDDSDGRVDFHAAIGKTFSLSKWPKCDN